MARKIQMTNPGSICIISPDWLHEIRWSTFGGRFYQPKIFSIFLRSLQVRAICLAARSWRSVAIRSKLSTRLCDRRSVEPVRGGKNGCISRIVIPGAEADQRHVSKANHPVWATDNQCWSGFQAAIKTTRFCRTDQGTAHDPVWAMTMLTLNSLCWHVPTDKFI